MDEKFLTHTFSISNHPIKKLRKPFNFQYVMGLGEFLCYMSDSSNYTKIIFETWAKSILGYVPPKSWSYTYDFKNLKTALYVKRDGMRFFTIRQSFIFDCFYLLSIYDKNLIINTYTFLLDKICGFFTRSVLTEIYNHFKGIKYSENAPKPLLRHQRLNHKFQKKQLKKILVVATMSAGKSTLINALVGYRINKAKMTACTNKICRLYNKPYEDGIITTLEDRKYNYYNDPEHTNSDDFISAGLHFNSTLSSEKICFIDTPGVNNSNDINHGEITRKAIKDNYYDAILFISNSQYFATNDEDKILSYTIENTRKPIIFILNQLDRFKKKDDSIKKMILDFSELLKKKKIKDPLIIPCSAQMALLMKLEEQNRLDEEDKFELQLFNKKFSDTYYDLKSYVSNEKSTSILSRTGIVLLEKMIKEI